MRLPICPQRKKKRRRQRVRMMHERIHFDTVAFREVGKEFEKTTLASDLRERMLISPITAFELLSQLTITNADEVLP
jgi:hypothetical protein